MSKGFKFTPKKPSKRKAISKRVRFDVFKRDGFECQYCGSHPPKAILHVDHITPVAEGGDNDPDNLVTACDACNLGKGARSLADVPRSLVDKAAEAAEREEQLRAYGEVMAAKRVRLEDETWRVADLFVDHFESKPEEGIRKDRFQSIKRFVELQGVHETLDAMEIAVARQPWNDNTCFRYFCGVCWRKIKEN